ncbi:MAG: hypothetical protein ABSH20_12360 [Tepidisphaeraceae bacterium]|jgi:hypothetical protein
MSSATSPGLRTWLIWIIDHNPCFILSGLSMLFGCHLLNLALYTPAGDTHKLLGLLAVVNVYELLLVAIGLVLIRKPVFVRDGRILLGLEAMFLCDVTFTSGIIATVDPRWGFGIAAVLLALAGLKLALILRVLDAPIAWRTWAFFMLQLSAVLCFAGVFKVIAVPRHGRLPEGVVYAGWWMAGLLPAVGMALRSLPTRKPAAPSSEMGLIRLFLILPFISLLVHLYSGGWVYSVPFRAACVAPVLLGVAFAVPALGRQSLVVAQFALATLAICFTTGYSHTLIFHAYGLTFTPMSLTIAGALAVAIHAIWLSRSLLAAMFVLVCSLTSLICQNLALIWATLVTLARWTWSLMPRTVGQCGTVAVVASFLLLGVGLWISSRRSEGGKEEVIVPETTPEGP